MNSLESTNAPAAVIPTTPAQEEGFSSKKYFLVALAVGAVAAGIFSVCLPAAIALIAVASWYLWSATIIELNKIADGSCLEKPIHHLHAMAMEVNTAVACAALFPHTLLESYHTPKSRPDADGRPIFLINGYLSFGSTWDYLRDKLVDAKLGPVYTMNLGSGDSIENYAEKVKEKVDRIRKETGKNEIILIGHSRGGLISSYYATTLAEAAGIKVTDVITIGSPLAGTPLAYLGVGCTDAAQMRPNADFNVNLRQKIEEHSNDIRFYHIASEADAVVSVSSAILENHPHYKLKDMGHLGLVFSSRVADQVCTWLKTPAPSAQAAV